MEFIMKKVIKIKVVYTAIIMIVYIVKNLKILKKMIKTKITEI